MARPLTDIEGEIAHRAYFGVVFVGDCHSSMANYPAIGRQPAAR